MHKVNTDANLLSADEDVKKQLITAYIAYQAQRMKTYREFLSLILKDLLLVTIILYLEANKSLDRKHVLLLLSP
jgi:protein tyrosine phosphatase